MTLILVGWSPDNASAVLPFVAASVAAALDRPGITEDLVVVFAPTRANGSDDTNVTFTVVLPISSGRVLVCACAVRRALAAGCCALGHGCWLLGAGPFGGRVVCGPGGSSPRAWVWM
jgi:hypothetical protein